MASATTRPGEPLATSAQPNELQVHGVAPVARIRDVYTDGPPASAERHNVGVARKRGALRGVELRRPIRVGASAAAVASVASIGAVPA
jgi:hypothetical protein